MKIKPTPTWLAAKTRGELIGVDREERVIRGFIVAEEGPFKDLRGEFNREAINQIAEQMLASPKGLKSRFTHPTLSDDGLGKFLGRAKNARVEAVERQGQERLAVRADLHLSGTAFETNPNGNLGRHVLDLAEEDSDALGASLVIRPREEQRLNEDGTILRDEDGEPLPPLWFPESLHAIDVVDEGDATHSFLGVEGLPDAVVRQACELLDKQFDGDDREVVEARAKAWLDRYLSWRFGEQEPSPRNSDVPGDSIRRGLWIAEKWKSA